MSDGPASGRLGVRILATTDLRRKTTNQPKKKNNQKNP